MQLLIDIILEKLYTILEQVLLVLFILIQGSYSIDYDD